MLQNRKRLIILIALVAVTIIVIWALFVLPKTSTNNTAKTDTAPLPTDAFDNVKKYFQARENSVGANHATPTAWANDVKDIVTSSWYDEISKKVEDADKKEFDIAKSNNLVVNTEIKSCNWNVEAGSHTNTEGPVYCQISDTTVDKTTGTIVQFESLPAGWSRHGARSAEVKIVKENNKWVVTKDTSELNPEVPAGWSDRNNINFEGISSLKDNGISDTQAEAMKQGFTQFAPAVKNVTISVQSINVPIHQKGDDYFHLTFTAYLDNIPYSCEVRYKSTDTLRLIVTSPQGKQVYDSGDIDGSTL